MTATPADRAAAMRLVLAHAEGRRAASEGRAMSSCPYDRHADDPITRAKARMWLRGYDRVAPFPVDYSS
ncbi:Rmf/CrpP fold protein [Thermomonospora cellulosilytica]|uniref:Ribosome modulation factor n=1 Tax=Thermomonospora cellulosilytica TaxID=1411118 RepID=A0A7W3MXE7_9ACTN|nr:Rmf/CrpP fold protein [Thermomonospora cellulosilytica]MBA9003672.1 ribosome modulation factor [Thermomonospora cellulosilytica]